MEVLGKLSIATMNCKPKRAHKDVDNIKTPLARIMGTASGLKSAVDQRGEPVFGLTGSFLGINIAEGLQAGQDGKDADFGQYRSGVLYLPGGIQELIQAPLEKALNDPDKAVANSAAIEFAMDLFAIPANNPAGYSFVATLLGEAAQADPFANIRQRVGDAKLPALPSPAEVKKAQEAAKAG